MIKYLHKYVYELYLFRMKCDQINVAVRYFYNFSQFCSRLTMHSQTKYIIIIIRKKCLIKYDFFINLMNLSQNDIL